MHHLSINPLIDQSHASFAFNFISAMHLHPLTSLRCITRFSSVPFLRSSLSTQTSPPNPLLLHRNNTTVHLLGTMHIAQASATAARSLIRQQYANRTLGGVFLELDPSRFQRLKQNSSQNPDQSLLSLAFSVLNRPSATPLASLIELAIAAMYRSLHRLGFASGVEFKAAIETAENLDVPLILGDQHITTTMSNVANAFRNDFDLQRLLSLVFVQARGSAAIETEVERGLREAFQAIAMGDVNKGQLLLAKLIDPSSVNELMKPMREFAPQVTKAILDDRDVVMTKNLIAAVDGLADGKSDLVAIVGLAHMAGIEKEWRKRSISI